MKYCKDCAHFSTHPFVGPRCNRPMGVELDPVMGPRSIELNGNCADERAPRTIAEALLGRPLRCGPEARFHTPARDQRAASANARSQAPRSPQDVGNSAEDKAADAAAQGQEA